MHSIPHKIKDANSSMTAAVPFLCYSPLPCTGLLSRITLILFELLRFGGDGVIANISIKVHTGLTEIFYQRANFPLDWYHH